MKIGVYPVLMSSPADTSGLEKLISTGVIDPQTLICGIGKTEGNGGANDFTRQLATVSYQQMLAKFLGTVETVNQRISFAWSGGTEGVLSPHATFFTREENDKGMQPSDGTLAVSVKTTRDFRPEEVGRMPEILAVADATRAAMADCGVSDPHDVHFAFVKGPLLTPAAIKDARSRGQSVVTTDPNRSKVFARGATALGVAIALGEVDAAAVNDDMVGTALDLYSEVACTSAGGELTKCEVILMVNSRTAHSDYRIGHGVLHDPLDVEGVLTTLRTAGLNFDCLPAMAERQRITAIFAKAEASPTGEINGYRNTMLSDADINYERHARAAVGAVIASVTKNPAIFLSGGTEHQCLPGEAPIAVIVRT